MKINKRLWFSQALLVGCVFFIFFIIQTYEPVKAYTKAPDFQLPIVKSSGLTKNHYHLKSQKTPYLILNFWASWCEICASEKPILIQLSKEMESHSKVKFVGIASEKELSVLLESKKLGPLNYTNLFDQDGVVAKKYQVQVLPQTYLIGPMKQILWKHSGAMTNKEVEYLKNRVFGKGESL